ncbi:MAG: glycosyltransferase [Actinomycetota bacterium]|nr:glycosyltransferase [Actinomycetota bacterium]
MTSAPRVTVLVPARNEAAHIETCLEAIAAQNYPAHRLEVLVVDGNSTDGTPDRAAEAIERLDFHLGGVVVNAEGSTPSNLNLGLALATGEIVCRVDARSLIPAHYVSRCVELLTSRPDVAVVGGAQVAVPPRDDFVGTGIARALNNRWGMGFSRYRRGAKSGPADTVYLGAFRTADLRAAGGWDHRLPTNQDFDLNRRLGSRGLIWFDSSLEVGYVPRSNLPDLYRQYRRFGSWKMRYWRVTNDRPRPRQVVLITAPLGLAAALAIAVRQPQTRGPAVLALAAAGVAVEVFGAEHPERAPLTSHVVATAALSAVSAGWLLGIWSELVRRHGD